MSERADLYVVVEEVSHVDGALIPGGPLFDVRPATPAEALTVLLPDVDWEALRLTTENWEKGFRRGESVMVGERSQVWRAARRLLAVYDGKDGA